ncbi:MAG TPA: Hsp33 family molecular chaperone HslO [Anaerolineae bacterium]
MEDYLVRILAKEAGVRGLGCVTTNLVNEACRRHNASPTAAAVLGRALTGVALMGALLKVQQRVALKFEGSGPLEKVLVESDSYGNVRGYVAEPEVDLPKVGDEHDVVSAIGRAGLLTVVKDLRLKNLYESVVPLASSDVDSDLTVYLEQSEQIPSLVEAGVIVQEDGDVAMAGGLLIQSMPPHGADIVEQLKDRTQELPPVEELLKSGKTPEEILALVFAGIDYEFLEKRLLQFKCGCSRARSEQALIALGREEIEMLLESEGQAVVDCHFCHERYVFSGKELEMLLEEL